MTRYMVDTVAQPPNGIVPNLPASISLPNVGTVDLELTMGYRNGAYTWKTKSPNVWVDVLGNAPDSSDVVDCETGDVPPSYTPTWVKNHNNAKASGGYPGIVYCSRSNLTPVFNAMAAAKLVIDKDFRIIIATLDGTERVPDMTGVVAVQAWGQSILKVNLDVSVVYDDSWKIPAVQHRYNPPAPPGEWQTASLVGIGTNGCSLFHTEYNSRTGQWTTPAKAPY